MSDSRLSSAFPALGVLALLLLLLFVWRGPEAPPSEPEETPPLIPLPLADLGERPDWSTLDRYHDTMTRAEFESALRDVYVLGSDWHCDLTNESVSIHTALAPTGHSVRFAGTTTASPARYWRPASELPAASRAKPLSHLRIAIDPGHLGGPWAKMEERWYQLDGGIPVTEGDMTLRTAKLLQPRLEALGATVTLVREKTEPVTAKRPEDFVKLAERKRRGAPSWEIQRLAERLFYRTAEIRARARKVNEEIRPDLILCLHYNAESWADPKNPSLTTRNHYHMILHGAYMDGEILHEDERLEMLHKVFQRIHSEERALSAALGDSLEKETGLPPYRYLPGKPATKFGRGLWARNLLANRLYRCPVLFFEPYVMNNREVYDRVQAGDYEGLKEIAGKQRRSLYREYVDAVVNGLVNYYESRRTFTD